MVSFCRMYLSDCRSSSPPSLPCMLEGQIWGSEIAGLWARNPPATYGCQRVCCRFRFCMPVAVKKNLVERQLSCFWL